MTTARTHLTTLVLVRLAGFSFQRLEQLRLTRAPRAHEAVVRARARTAAEAARLEAAAAAERFDDHPELGGAEPRNKLLRALRRMQAFAERGGPAPDALEQVLQMLPSLAEPLSAVRSAWESRTRAEAEYRRCFEEEIAAAAGVLRSLFAADARLMEAVFLESPAAHDGLERLLAGGQRTSKMKQRERTAILYLQRFCAKNDTNSFCGPVAVSFLDPAEDGDALTLEWHRDVALRQTYFSYWAAEALRRALSARHGPEARFLRRNPAARLFDRDGEPVLSWCTIEHDATELFRRTYARASISREIARAYALTAEPISARTLAADLGLDADRAEALIDGLVEQGILLEAPILPTGCFRPLDVLAAHAEAWASSEEQALLSELRGLVERFSSAPLQGRVELSRELAQRFEASASTGAARGGGQHYADRGLLHEDCLAEVSVTAGAAAVEALREKIGTLADASSLPLELARENVRHWFEQRFGRGVRVPLLEVHRAFDKEAPHAVAAPTEKARGLEAAIRAVKEVLAGAIIEGASEAQVSSQALRPILDRAPGMDRPGYASADVMLQTGTPRWIVGELHGFFLLPTFWFDAAPEAARTRALDELRSALAALAGDRLTAEPLFLHTQATDRRFALGEVDLQLAGASDRPGALELGALELSLEDGLCFWSGTREVAPVSPYTVYPFLTYTSPVAPLIDDFAGKFVPRALLPDTIVEGDAPRLVLDGAVVFRRRTWTRTAAELGAALAGSEEHEICAAAYDLGARLGGGMQYFVTVPGQPKPLLVDLLNPFLVDAFVRLVRQLEPAQALRWTEMLPLPGVLNAADGPRTCELRLGVWRGV